MKKTSTNNNSFSEKHPVANFVLGCFILFSLLISIKYGYFKRLFLFLSLIEKGLNQGAIFLKHFVSTTDKVIIVAMITGSVSIIGVVISSIIAKIIEYRYNVKKYMYDKRELPYEQFINMIYTIMEDTQKPNSLKMSESEMLKQVSEFSKGLTLWGSNRVVKKWLKYRKASQTQPSTENLILLEDIIYEIRRDVGQRKRLKKGDKLSFFINDIETIINSK